MSYDEITEAVITGINVCLFNVSQKIAFILVTLYDDMRFYRVSMLTAMLRQKNLANIRVVGVSDVLQSSGKIEFPTNIKFPVVRFHSNTDGNSYSQDVLITPHEWQLEEVML